MRAASRTHEVLTLLSEVFATRASAGPVFVVVDGPPGSAPRFADRLAESLAGLGQPAVRLTDVTPLADEDTWLAGHAARIVVIGDGPRWRAHPPVGAWDAVVYLRTERGSGDESGASVVVDCHDPEWPVIRRLDPGLADADRWYVPESRAFFGVRAAGWDTKFGDDGPAYAAAVGDGGLPLGATVLDVGCGTGRALPALRTAVGPGGLVIGLDVTPDMLRVARDRVDGGPLVLADARRLPLGDRSVDAIFAAGLVQHLPDPAAGLAELARVTRPGGTLVVFHPSGRAALAARHGRTLRADEPLGAARFGPLLAGSGWRLEVYDDPPHRFFARARRT